MNSTRFYPVRSALPARQRGVVLFVALVVMVALSLAAIALIRSVDTTNTVIGNLAFRQASILPANLAIEEAAAALFQDADIPHGVRITDHTVSWPAENYYASKQADDPHGVPLQLQKRSNYPSSAKLLVDATTHTEVRYVIERMCLTPGPATIGNCDLVPPKVNPGTTIGDSAIALPSIPFYRVTVRVDGPKNTASFVQASLR
jgi:type IV pilus assembly protein PilX